MKKVIFGLAALAVIVFSGCGGGEAGSAAAPTNSVTAPSNSAKITSVSASVDVTNASVSGLDGLPPIPQIPVD